jgi:hypothetical protein
MSYEPKLNGPRDMPESTQQIQEEPRATMQLRNRFSVLSVDESYRLSKIYKNAKLNLLATMRLAAKYSRCTRAVKCSTAPASANLFKKLGTSAPGRMGNTSRSCKGNRQFYFWYIRQTQFTIRELFLDFVSRPELWKPLRR